MKHSLSNWLHRAFAPSNKRRIIDQYPSTTPQCESLEERLVMDATLASIGNAQFIGGQDLYVALDGSDPNGPVTYTANSSNGSVTATVLTGGRSISMTVSGKDSSGNDFSGTLTFRLFEDVAPITTARIISLIQSGFYNGLSFHRIIDGFVAQGGDPAGNGTGGSGTKIPDEYSSTVTFNSRGLLAMANSGDDTGDSQFFITDIDVGLDSQLRNLNYNHTIFGILTSGFETFDKLIKTPVSGSSPVNPVIMSNVTVFEDNQHGVLKISAADGFTGPSTITVTATGTGTPVTQNFLVTGVQDTQNDRAFLGPVTDLTTAVNTPITFTVTGIDLERDNLTFQVKDPSSWSSSSSTGTDPLNVTVSIQTTQANGTTPASATITITPNTGFTGTVELLIGVRDNTNRNSPNALETRGNYDTQKVTLTVSGTATNLPPVANAGGPYTIAEGDSLVLNASASTDPDPGDTLSYSWDVNGDGTFGDATGVNPTLTKAQLNSLGINSGTATFNVRVRVDDGHGNVVVSDPTTFTFNNAPPVATITGPSSGTKEQVLTFTLGATDQSSGDQTAGFTWEIDWDSDSVVDQTVTGTSTKTVEHSYTTAGAKKITITATDRDGAESASVSFTVNIEGIDLVNGTLNVVGTAADDSIKIIRDKKTGQPRLYMNGEDMGAFDVTNGLNLVGGAGNDRIYLWPDVKAPAIINGGDGDDNIKGGAGNDELHGGAGNDVIIGRSGDDQIFGEAGLDFIDAGGGKDIVLGGDGNDEIRSGSGNDVIIGGAGSDRLYNGNPGDLMIGGNTDFDSDNAALQAIRDAWNSQASMVERIVALSETGVGTNNAIKLTVSAEDPEEPTLPDDAAEDRFFGILGPNWYLGFEDDVFQDPKKKGFKTIG